MRRTCRSMTNIDVVVADCTSVWQNVALLPSKQLMARYWTLPLFAVAQFCVVQAVGAGQPHKLE